MANNQRRDNAKELYWRKALERFRESGLSQTAFCEREKHSPNTFSWWKKEIALRDAAKEAAAKAPGMFVPLSVVGEQERPATFSVQRAVAEIDLDRRVLRIFNGADAATIRSLLHALKE